MQVYFLNTLYSLYAAIGIDETLSVTWTILPYFRNIMKLRLERHELSYNRPIHPTNIRRKDGESPGYITDKRNPIH